MIRRALWTEHEILTDISFRAKRYWQYPEQYFQIWNNELTITPGYINSHETYVHEDFNDIQAFYSLVELPEEVVLSGVRIEAGVWLDHMFVVPEKIGFGIGRGLFRHCLQRFSTGNVDRLRILSDPHACGFYEKMGCVFIDDFPSNIPGRKTPYLHYIF